MSAIPEFFLVNYRMRQFLQLSPEHQDACKRYSHSQVQKQHNILDFSIFYSDCFLRYINDHFDSMDWFHIFLSSKAFHRFRNLSLSEQEAAFRHCTASKKHHHASPAKYYTARFLNLMESGALPQLGAERKADHTSNEATTKNPAAYFRLEGEALAVFKTLSKQDRAKVREHCEHQAAQTLNAGGTIDHPADFSAKIFFAYLQDEFYGVAGPSQQATPQGQHNDYYGPTGAAKNDATTNHHHHHSAVTLGTGDNNHHDIPTIQRMIEAKERENAELQTEIATLRQRNSDAQFDDHYLELLDKIEFLEERHATHTDAHQDMKATHTQLSRELYRVQGAKRKYENAFQQQKEVSKQQRAELERLQAEANALLLQQMLSGQESAQL